MTIKHMMVVVMAAVALVGTAFADGPKEAPKAKADKKPAVCPIAQQQAEIRKAWQQGFEQGYQRAMSYRDNQQTQQRQRMMKQRKEMVEKFRAARKGPQAEGAAPKGPKAERGDRPRRPEMKGDRRGRKGQRKYQKPQE